jgi:hypothetical protein
MAAARTFDIPHQLGRDEARRRMGVRVGELPAHLPGGVAEVRSSWPSDDVMALDITAMGQHVTATLEVQDRVIRVSMVLPPMLRFMSGTIVAAAQRKGAALLLRDDREG